MSMVVSQVTDSSDEVEVQCWMFAVCAFCPPFLFDLVYCREVFADVEFYDRSSDHYSDLF